MFDLVRGSQLHLNASSQPRVSRTMTSTALDGDVSLPDISDPTAATVSAIAQSETISAGKFCRLAQVFAYN
jgi:hypothetical protein